jgi:uncharacterized protein (DUF1778 family)
MKNKKSKQINFLASPNEKALIEQAAKITNISISQLIRECALIYSRSLTSTTTDTPRTKLEGVI